MSQSIEWNKSKTTIVKLYREIFGAGMLGSLAGIACYALIKYLSGEKIALSEIIVIGIILFIVVVFAVVLLLSVLFRRRQWEELAYKTGISNVYPGFYACQDEMFSALRVAHETRIFLQIGTSVLSGKKTIYEFLEELHVPAEATIKIMHVSDESPYLSSQAARERKESDRSKWVADIQHARSQLAGLRRRLGRGFDSREHEEPFVWRLFLIDDVGYIQPYLFDSKNSDRANVLKVIRHRSVDPDTENPAQSLFDMASRYFDAMWEKYPPKSMSLELLIGRGAQITVAAVAKIRGYFLFSIPIRNLALNPDVVEFHALGGKPDPGEAWVDAIQREVEEESGLRARVRAASSTLFLDNENQPVYQKVSDKPAPQLARKRVKDKVLWTLGYDVYFVGDVEPTPKAETAALLLLSPAMLRRSRDECVTYDDVLKAQDGSRVITRREIQIEPTRQLKPGGLAPFIKL
jgi:hypothetical protein